MPCGQLGQLVGPCAVWPAGMLQSCCAWALCLRLYTPARAPMTLRLRPMPLTPPACAPPACAPRPSGMRPSPLRHVLPAPPLAWLAANPPPLSPALACSANKVGRDAPRAQCGPRPHPREYECRDLAVGHVGPLHPYPDCGAGRGGGGIIIRSIRIYYILSSSFIIITVLFRYYYYCYP